MKMHDFVTPLQRVGLHRRRVRYIRVLLFFRRSVLAFGLLIAALVVLAYESAAHRDARVELQQARAEIARLKGLPPQKVCRPGRNNTWSCVLVHRGT